MSTQSCLFLSPSTRRRLAVVFNPSYLRLYHAVRGNGLAQGSASQYPRIVHEVPSMRIPDFRQKYKDMIPSTVADEEIALRGRIQSVRWSSSKLVFLDFSSEYASVQGMCNLRKLRMDSSDPGYVPLKRFKEVMRTLQRGDIVALTGRATRTQTGELTIEASRLPVLLSPSLVPLPIKLSDHDTRIASRHVDMLVNKPVSDTLRLRAYMMRYMRDHFHARGFLEFQTPILADNAGGAVARPFVTRASELGDQRELALRIAPELWLKRLVVGGLDRVFEIGPVFRNEGIDLTHNPEFTICESYSAYASLNGLVGQTEELLLGMARHCQELIADSLTSLPEIDVERYAGPYKRIEFIPSLEAALGAELPDLAAHDALPRLLSMVPSRIRLFEIPPLSQRSLPKLLDYLAARFLEPHSDENPLFITHHPFCMSPLSKSFVCPKTSQLVSARAELFIGGSELANMYEEENDPSAQRQKFVDQARGRSHNTSARIDSGEDQKVEDMPVDESYIQALRSGLPPTGGWGCGIERLVMLFAGTRRINDCLSFGTLRNVVGLSSSACPAARAEKERSESQTRPDNAQAEALLEKNQEKRHTL